MGKSRAPQLMLLYGLSTRGSHVSSMCPPIGGRPSKKLNFLRLPRSRYDPTHPPIDPKLWSSLLGLLAQLCKTATKLLKCVDTWLTSPILCQGRLYMYCTHANMTHENINNNFNKIISNKTCKSKVLFFNMDLKMLWWPVCLEAWSI